MSNRNNTVEQKILETVDDLREELVNLTAGAVKIKSITPTYSGINRAEVIGGESEVSQYFKNFMDSIGLETDMWEEEKDRANVVGIYEGNGEGKSLIFNGHVDVVPPGPEEKWTKAKPWSGLISDGKIWGRGSCDMKGGIAATLIGLKAVLKAGFKPKGKVIISNVVGEEMMNTEAGTGAMIKRGYKADAGIVVEPSAPPYRLGLVPASAGAFYMVCTIKGKAGHASMRDELVRPGGTGEKVGVSSIDKSFIIYEGLKKLEEEWGQTKSHPMFTRPGHFTIHPGVITGGSRGPFVISEESRIEYAIWHAPQDSKEQVMNEIETQIYRFAQTDPWLRKNPPKVEWLVWWPPFDVPKNAPICKTIESAYKNALGRPIKYYGFAGNNDASFLNLAGIPTITIGPGNLFVAHSPNEYVEIEELIDAAKIYALTIAQWCKV